MLDLYYREETGWQPLPAWTDFFYRIGYATARSPAPSTVIVLTPEATATLPLIALGTVTGYWSDETAIGRSPAEQWEALMRLRPGTPVSYAHLRNRDGVHSLRLACLRVSDTRSADELALEFRRGSGQRTPDRLLIRRAETERIFRVSPLNGTPRGFVPDTKMREVDISAVLGAFLPGQLYGYYTQSTSDCLLLGTDTRLRQESSLALGRPDGTQLGTIGDVLRLREGNNTWHTMICPLRGHVPQGGRPFRTVVFDGPTAWLRHRTDYAQSSHIVVAEHTHPILSELLDEVRETMRDGAAPIPLRKAVMPVPLGLEIISFHRQ